MNKNEFLKQLQNGLNGLPDEDIKEQLSFYGEMIDDRTEDGMSEEDAVLEIGDANEIASQIIADIPLTKLVKEKMAVKKKPRVWEIVLLALGSPIWFSLAVALLAIIFTLYAVLWALIISLWATFAALAVCGAGGVLAGFVIIFKNNIFTGICLIGAGLLCAGLSILLFFGCILATKGALILTEKILSGIKKSLLRKGEAE